MKWYWHLVPRFIRWRLILRMLAKGMLQFTILPDVKWFSLKDEDPPVKRFDSGQRT